MRRLAARSLAVGLCGLAPTILLAGCGGDDDGSNATLVPIEPSSYVVKEPATTTTTIAGQAPTDEEGRSTVEQEYTIVANDYPAKVAELYGISVDELANYNSATPGYGAFYVGLVIKIPPGALIPGATTATDAPDASDGTEAPSDTDSDGTTAPAPTTLPTDENGCTTGTHTIAEGDIPIRVAEQYDITVDQLNAANANTPGYSAFYPGLEIVIPC